MMAGGSGQPLHIPGIGRPFPGCDDCRRSLDSQAPFKPANRGHAPSLTNKKTAEGGAEGGLIASCAAKLLRSQACLI